MAAEAPTPARGARARFPPAAIPFLSMRDTTGNVIRVRAGQSKPDPRCMKLAIEAAALEQLRTAPGKITVISLVGISRSGKSTTVNAIIAGLIDAGKLVLPAGVTIDMARDLVINSFKPGHTHDPETVGVDMLVLPLTNGNTLVLLDMEGLDNLDHGGLTVLLGCLTQLGDRLVYMGQMLSDTLFSNLQRLASECVVRAARADTPPRMPFLTTAINRQLPGSPPVLQTEVDARLQGVAASFPRRAVLNLPYVRPIPDATEDPAKDEEDGPIGRAINEFTVREICATAYGRRVKQFALDELNPPGSPEFFMDLAGLDGAAREPVPHTGDTYVMHVKALEAKTNEDLSNGYLQVRTETVAETVRLFSESEADKAFNAHVAGMPSSDSITAEHAPATLTAQSDAARVTALTAFDCAVCGVKHYTGCIAARATLDSRISAHLATCITRSDIKREAYRAQLCSVITEGRAAPVLAALTTHGRVVLPPDDMPLATRLGGAVVVGVPPLKSQLQNGVDARVKVVETEREALNKEHAYNLALERGRNPRNYDPSSPTGQRNRSLTEGEARRNMEVAAAALAIAREAAAKFPVTPSSFEVDLERCMASTNNSMLSYVAWWAVVTEATTGNAGEWAEMARHLRETTGPVVANSAGMTPLQIASMGGPDLCVALRAALSE